MNDSPTPALRLRGLRRQFPGQVALDGIDLDVGADELLVVLGPTGAGKTTLLRTIAGLERPDGGSITLGGRDAAGLAPAVRDVALVFQNFSLYPEWTVRENIVFPLRAPGRNLDQAEIDRRIAWAADLLKLGTMLDRPAHRLSGGQMQRVAIGRAIVRRPALFLMDEPLTNLDAKLREQLRVELTVLRRQLRIPMVYVTHDQAEALSMGDRIAVLDRGRILQIGTPEQVYEQPASPVVARQLGQPAINLLNAERRDGWWCTADGLRLAPAGGTGRTATVGIRPEQLALTGGDESATISAIEHLGAFRVAIIRWRQQVLRVAVPAAQTMTEGDAVHPRIATDQVMVWPDAGA